MESQKDEFLRDNCEKNVSLVFCSKLGKKKKVKLNKRWVSQSGTKT